MANKEKLTRFNWMMFDIFFREHRQEIEAEFNELWEMEIQQFINIKKYSRKILYSYHDVNKILGEKLNLVATKWFETFKQSNPRFGYDAKAPGGDGQTLKEMIIFQIEQQIKHSP